MCEHCLEHMNAEILHPVKAVEKDMHEMEERYKETARKSGLAPKNY